MTDKIAFGIELEHRRRAGAALAGRRIQLETFLVVAERRGSAMDDPHVIALIDGHANRRSEDPMIRHGLRPERIHFEIGSLNRVAALAREFPRDQHAGYGEHDQDEDKPAVRQPFAHGSLLERGDYIGSGLWALGFGATLPTAVL